MQGAEEHGANTPAKNSGGFARSNNALDGNHPHADTTTATMEDRSGRHL